MLAKIEAFDLVLLVNAKPNNDADDFQNHIAGNACPKNRYGNRCQLNHKLASGRYAIGKPKPANMMNPIDHVTTDIADIMARANSDRTYLQRLALALPPVLPGSPENKKMNAKNKSKRQLLNLMLDPVYQLK